MGGLAEELHLRLDDAERRAPDLRAAAAVDHHGGVDAVEDAGVHELHLAGAAFLGRRADHLDAAGEGQGPERLREGGAGPDAGGGDHVVAACVTDAGQRIVLGHDGDGGTGGGAGNRRPERGRQSTHAALHGGSVLGEEVGEPGVRLVLLERQLGVDVQLVREPLELIGEGVDGCRHARLDGVTGAHFAASNSRRASFTRAGLARRSQVVMAMILAAFSMPSRASGFTAASAKAREWIGVPSGAICTIGWMAGITWLTLPMSDDPMRSRLSGDSTTPNVRALARKSSSSVALRFIGS